MRFKDSIHSARLTARLLTVAVIGLLCFVCQWQSARPWYDRAFAQVVQPTVSGQDRALQYQYLPLVSNKQSAVATATPTPTNVPTVTPTPTTEPQATTVALFLEDAWRTSSAALKQDNNGGLHVGYYYYEGQHDGAPNYAVYAYCPADCGEPSHWAKVNLAEDRDVLEVQLALTSSGHPRLLIRADSTVYPGGKDYLYAACDQNCASQAGWQVGYVLSSDGTDIFNVYDDDAPQRSFTLDPQDRPRFLYQDRNYAHAEPDHYGHYYVRCDSNCTAGTPDQPTWQQTRITEEYRDQFSYEYEILDYPSLTFTKAGGPRVLGVLYPTSHSATPEGLYYFGCDTNCDQRENWHRVYLLDRGSGTAVSWDLALDSQDRPRLALYRGTGTFEAEKVLYLWCNENCLDQATKDDHWEFNDPGVEVTNGRHPDLVLNGRQQPRIAYVDQLTGGLGYAWCTADCESDNATWHHQTVEDANVLQTDWPVALPVSCLDGLWHGLTPVLALDSSEHATVAYDTTYHAQCLYDDPSDGEPPFTAFHEIVRAVRAVGFQLP
ncbi:MAG TPA: hypothetical protein P5121_36665 [Caldilineaceae bacterium]|nr:hypothetical protein [Caldilineaceae bacterium]